MLAVSPGQVARIRSRRYLIDLCFRCFRSMRDAIRDRPLIAEG
jgi:hypothetical protein